MIIAVFGMTAIGWNGVQLSEVARHAPAGQAGAVTGASGPRDAIGRGSLAVFGMQQFGTSINGNPIVNLELVRQNNLP